MTADTAEKSTKAPKALTKVVIRRLPPTMTEEELRTQLEPMFAHDYFRFEPADPSLAPWMFARAYISFMNADDILLFRDQFDGYVFLDGKGNEFTAVVELAPSQKVPGKAKKADAKCATIEDDADYKKFLEEVQNPTAVTLPTLEAMLEENEKRTKELKESQVRVTPLVQFVQEKRIDDWKRKEEKRRAKEAERKRRIEEERERRRREQERAAAAAEREREQRQREKERQRVAAEKKAAAKKKAAAAGDDEKFKAPPKAAKADDAAETSAPPKEKKAAKTAPRGGARSRGGGQATYDEYYDYEYYDDGYDYNEQPQAAARRGGAQARGAQYYGSRGGGGGRGRGGGTRSYEYAEDDGYYEYSSKAAGGGERGQRRGGVSKGAGARSERETREVEPSGDAAASSERKRAKDKPAMPLYQPGRRGGGKAS